MSREAMKQALEALEFEASGWEDVPPITREAITALRQALKTEQEPVAWASSLDFDDDDQEIIPAKDKGKLGTSNCNIPLYTAPPKRDLTCVCGAVWERETMVHPPRKREWVGLTDEEVSDVIDNVLEGGGWLDVARALEAAIKRKNT